MSSVHLLRALGYLGAEPNPTIAKHAVPLPKHDAVIENLGNNVFAIKHNGKSWQIESAIVLSV